MAKLVVLIETTDRRGAGTDADPVRLVTQWFTTDGVLVVEHDPFLQPIAPLMVDFSHVGARAL